MRTVGLFGATGVAFCLLATSCAHGASPAPKSAQTANAAGAVTGEASTTSATKATHASLPFIEDDYGRALAEAKAKNKLLFVDGWATWCHSCLSLKSYVLTAPEMRAEADKFVWLSLDSEKEKNAPYYEKFGLEALPTLWVIDPRTEQIAWKLVGTVTAPELVTALDALTNKGAGDADGLFAEASRVDMRKDPAAAARLLEKVLATAPRSWPRRAEAVSAYVSALASTKQFERAAEIATREGEALPMSSYRVNIAVVGAGCAAEQSPGSTARGYLASLIKDLTAIVHLPVSAPAENGHPATMAPILADDRSGAFDQLISALKTENQKDAAKQMAGEWAKFLEGEARRAPDARGRAVFDAHRMLAYNELGDPARAIPMFLETERDFSDDYNPSARLGRVYFDLKRYDEALGAISRAIGKAYGPRKLRLYQLKADIAAAKKDPAEERKALDDALAYANTVSLRESYEKVRAQLAERRAKLGTPTAQR
ncbi:MAG TPA: thioredoxin family protein [Polyangiaceae bacterium]|nr:thioredoxin family protein [Polyangiaceae bacterium]